MSFFHWVGCNETRPPAPEGVTRRNNNPSPWAWPCLPECGQWGLCIWAALGELVPGDLAVYRCETCGRVWKLRATGDLIDPLINTWVGWVLKPGRPVLQKAEPARWRLVYKKDRLWLQEKWVFDTQWRTLSKLWPEQLHYVLPAEGPVWVSLRLWLDDRRQKFLGLALPVPRRTFSRYLAAQIPADRIRYG